MLQNPFSDLNDNEQRLTIERNVEQRLSEIEVQMQRVAEDTQEFQRLQTEKEVLEGIRMPDELRKALESDPQALELEIQTQLVRDNDLYNKLNYFTEKLGEIEELSKTNPKIKELLMVHQIYTWSIKDLSYTGYRNYGQRPTFEEMMHQLLQGEQVDTYKNDEAVQTLKNAIADGIIEVLPPQQIRDIIQTIDALRSSSGERYITAQDCRTVPYYNQVLYGEQPGVTEEMKNFYGTFNPIPKKPVEVFQPIQEYVQILPKELMDFSTSYAEIFQFGLMPGRQAYCDKLDSARAPLDQLAQNLRGNIEQTQNYLAVADFGMLYETKTAPMLNDPDVLRYLSNMRQLESFQPETRLSESEMEHVRNTYSEEELRAISSIMTSNNKLYQCLMQMDTCAQRISLYDEEFIKKCDDFDDLFEYLYSGQQRNEFANRNLQKLFKDYYRSTKGEKVSPDVAPAIERLKQLNPELFSQIMQAYESPYITEAYQELQEAKKGLSEDAIASQMRTRLGPFGIGKKKAEEEKRNLEVAARHTYELANIKWHRENELVRESFLPKFVQQYKEIKKIYPEAEFFDQNGTKIAVDDLEKTVDTVETYVSSTINGNHVRATKADLQKEREMAQNAFGRMSRYNPALQKYANDSQRPSLRAVNQLANGTYETEMMKSDVNVQVREMVVNGNAINM